MLLLKKITVFIILISLIMLNCFPAGAQVIPVDQLTEVEMVLLGSTVDNSILGQIERIEKNLYGQIQEGTMVERANRIITEVLPSSRATGLLFQVNALEWSLTGRVEERPLVERINYMEEMLLGRKNEGALTARMENLLDLSLPGGEIPAEQFELPADTLVRIKLLDKLNSQEAKKGQEIEFEVVRDIRIEETLLISKGTRGNIIVEDVEKAGKMGRDAEIRFRFSEIRVLDGTRVPLIVDEESEEENKSRNLAVGASLLGTALLGPVGLIAGYFVEGEEEEIPAGSEMYVQTGEEIQTYGLLIR